MNHEVEEGQCREWYEAYGAQVYSYLRFHLPSADAAEEVTAETFYKAVRGASKYDPAKGEPRFWLFRIARNSLHDYQRREQLRRHTPLGQLRDLVADAPSPEERLLWEEQVARLLDAVAVLPERDRELIGLRYGSDLETSEIASLLGVQESAVRTRLWRALKRLRGVMDDEEW
ncbi:MAG TPA: sigma-70 family RNA polymerase sigma factor [Gemmatimonadales bacterium]|nr:sigma-70 family RNA polymerase sigma factor [Gemmatimonadales bacterium]